MQPKRVIEVVNEGILDPEGERINAWRFSHIAIEIARKVARFQRHLDINLARAALALVLLECIIKLVNLLERGR